MSRPTGSWQHQAQHRGRMWAASPAFRRQLVLLRSLLPQSPPPSSPPSSVVGRRFAPLSSPSGTSGSLRAAHAMAAATVYEADAEAVVRRITPPLDRARHNGQAGNIAVIGGCREYTGAPYFAATSALKVGADLSHVFCTKDAATVIKSYSPELIVHPILEESYSVKDDERASVSSKILTEVAKWMERFDCIVIGPGLGRDSFLLDCVSNIMKHARQANIPTVVDGDGLFLITNNLGLVEGNPLAILTPNVYEYKRLVQKVLNCDVSEETASEQLTALCQKIGGVTIMRKGKADVICDGKTVTQASTFGSPRRCGGQGDILSGSVAVFTSWAQHFIVSNEQPTEKRVNPMTLGCIAGSLLLRKAASLAFEKNKRSTVTTDIIEFLGKS
ncbi:ATP-dependent (S)-NAD(P)H-hydrate dehydratase-like isoform X2 [Panicum virgatum]|uniref:ATP-dependent (S)-NAD(P)H-hydrate dehydratase-like isoform X2 n=1 Tax=Panicum virgatum TaxID=38727 RepID=UPI0019D57284|nr:ATP-dependent (S)-NAD(P)H-hydrate dehydratase-like isoform X2 [Panicum virgatum]